MRNVIDHKGGDGVGRHVRRRQISQPLQYFIHDEVLGEAAHEEKTRSCAGKTHLPEHHVKGIIKTYNFGQHSPASIQ
ncbi:hypothetical protein D3C81_1742350 [compost metagenome]